MIDEKDKEIKKLLDLLERSYSNNNNIIIEKDKRILELDGIVQSKVIEEPLAALRKNIDKEPLKTTSIHG